MEYSGNIKLRIPKSLHGQLLETAKKEGVSLNQYCTFCLAKNIEFTMLNRETINLELAKIRDKNLPLEELLDAIEKISRTVSNMRDSIIEEVNNVQGERKMSEQAKRDMENRFPVAVGLFRVREVVLKIPTVRLIFKRASFEAAMNDILAATKEEHGVLLTENHFDDLLGGVPCQLKLMDALSKSVIYFMNEGDFAVVREKVKNLLKIFPKDGDLLFEPTFNYVPLNP